MKVIAAAARDDLNVGSARTPECCIIQRRLHFEFLNGFGSGDRNVDRRARAHRVGVDTVNLHIVLRHARAINGNSLRISSEAGAVRQVSRDAR